MQSALNGQGRMDQPLKGSAIGGEAPGIGAVANNSMTFTRQETRFTPPDTVSYAWQVAVNYTVDAGGTKADVAGALGLIVSLTYTPHQPTLAMPGQPLPVAMPAPSRDLGSFFEAYGPAIATAAVVVAVVMLVVATDGLILIPLAAAA